MAANAPESQAGRVARLLWAGTPDSQWGTDGITAVSVARGRSELSDVIPIQGEAAGVWAIGTASSDGTERAALWKLDDAGQPDRTWMEGGPLLVGGGEPSQGIALGWDGTRLLTGIARTGPGGRTIEIVAVDAVRTTDPAEVIGRQPYSPNWSRPPALVREQGEWRWVDMDHPGRFFVKVNAPAQATREELWALAPKTIRQRSLLPFVREDTGPERDRSGTGQQGPDQGDGFYGIYLVIVGGALLLIGLAWLGTRSSSKRPQPVRRGSRKRT